MVVCENCGQEITKDVVHMERYDVGKSCFVLTYVYTINKSPETKKCECGAESCKTNIHSSWCPKYE